MKKINVVAAIIVKNNKILCVQRNKHKFDYVSYKYEFPGGKIEINETKEAALIREIKEELETDILIEKEFITVNHIYPDFEITMFCYICKSLSDSFVLKEHINLKWLSISDLNTLDWAAADIPVVNELMNNFKRTSIVRRNCLNLYFNC